MATGGHVEDIQESKAAKRLSKKVNRIIKQLDGVMDNVNKEKVVRLTIRKNPKLLTLLIMFIADFSLYYLSFKSKFTHVLIKIVHSNF